MPGFYVLESLLPNRIQPSGLGVSFNAPIPSVLEINFAQAVEKFRFFTFRQFLHRFDNFCDGTHTKKLIRLSAVCHLACNLALKWLTPKYPLRYNYE